MPSQDEVWARLREERDTGIKSIPVEQVLFGDEEALAESLLPRASSTGWFDMLVEFYYKSYGVPVISIENRPLTGKIIVGLAYPPRGWKWEGTATYPKPTVFFEWDQGEARHMTREQVEQAVVRGFRKILEAQ